MKYILMLQEEQMEKSIDIHIRPLIFEDFKNEGQLLVLNDNVKKVISLWDKKMTIPRFFEIFDEQGDEFDKIEDFYSNKFNLSIFTYRGVE